VRVVDLTTVVMGPMATRILGDLGADVVKVEAPGGDFPRHFEPARHPGMSGFWLNLNRNKRSVVLDLTTDEGRQAFYDLIATADVFVTNLRSRALNSLGVAEPDLRAVRPDLVYCSGRGFGRTGPYADKAAYDDVIQAGSGLASLFERVNGEPAYVPTIIADKVAALHITYAVLAALYRRATTGQGDYIEVPMAEALAAFNLVEHLGGHAFDPPLGEFGYGRLMSRSRRPLRSADGWVCIMPYSDSNWRDFFAAADRPDAADDPRFASLNDRVANVDVLYRILGEIVTQRTTAEWMELCDRLSIPAVPVVDLEHADADPHLGAVGLLRTVDHPTEGPYRRVLDPVTFAAGNGGLRRHAPGLGEHTADVLRELGYDEARIAALLASTTPDPDPPSATSVPPID
jgi:crotonobetainyl-CoA:carnitine CoA-transferase CaiB-like acyl-CoA transferase